MKHLYEDSGDAVYSEAHAKELLNVQANYNNKLKILNDELAKQKSQLQIKYMKIDAQQAAQKSAQQKGQETTKPTQPTPTTQKQTGTVDSAGNPTNAKGNPASMAKVESYPDIDILNINAVNEEGERMTGKMDWANHTDMRNWYDKPVTGGFPEKPERAPRKRRLTWDIRMKMQDVEGQIEDEKQNMRYYTEALQSPEDSVSGEVEEFFAQIGSEASDILNSGISAEQKFYALKEAGIKDPQSIMQDYYYYYPEFNPDLDDKRKEADKEIPKIQAKIDKLQAKLDKMETMYESMNEAHNHRGPLPVAQKINGKWEIESFPGLAEAVEGYHPFEILAAKRDPGYGYDHVIMLFIKFTKGIPKKYQTPENTHGLLIWDMDNKEFIEEPGSLEDYGIDPENLQRKTGFSMPGFDDMDESLNETEYNTENVDPYELGDLKDYLDAENISYSEDESGTIDFDETELDAEWRDRMDNMGFEAVSQEETGDILSMEDDTEETDDIAGQDEKIGEDKVFYVQVDDEGESFIGKIYKLFDEGDWRSKLVDGTSETFEKLNYDPDWDEVDIIAFLRENYADAQLMTEEEFNNHAEEPVLEPEHEEHEEIPDVTESVHRIPTLDDFLKEK